MLVTDLDQIILIVYLDLLLVEAGIQMLLHLLWLDATSQFSLVEAQL